MNHVSLIGHLAYDPEFRETAKGERIALLTVVTTGDDPEQSIGRSKVSTSCAAFVEFAERSLRKGSRVHVEGSLHTRYWVDANNIERYSTEVFIGDKTGRLELEEKPTRATARKSRTGLSQSSP